MLYFMQTDSLVSFMDETLVEFTAYPRKVTMEISRAVVTRYEMGEAVMVTVSFTYNVRSG